MINRLTLNFHLKIGRVLFILIITVQRMNVSAQPALTIYADASKNILSEGSNSKISNYWILPVWQLPG